MSLSAKITLISADPSRLDPAAVDQLKATASYEGIARVVGLPDLHVGSGIAVGAAFWSPDRVWPHLVGGDIGCGIGLWELISPLRKFRLGSVERKLHGLDEPWSGDTLAAVADFGLPRKLAGPRWARSAAATTSWSSSASKRSSTAGVSMRSVCMPIVCG